MKINEMIAVMQAFDEGKQIQFKKKNHDTWINMIYAIWNFDELDYRITPEAQEPKLRPYANTEEFIDAQWKHGLYIAYTDYTLRLPTILGKCKVGFGEMVFTYSDLVNFKWNDGTPCGIMEE